MTLSFEAVAFGYRRRIPVFGRLDFSFDSGSTVLLGPNGAGKSTMLGLAASVLRPQAGSVTFDGLDSSRLGDRASYRRRITWMPQRMRAIPGLTTREQVAYVGWLKGMSRKDAWEASAGALETAGLTAQESTKASKLSGGQLQRLGLAQSIVHSADLVLMDEPTAGLDPEQRRRFREMILELRSHASLIVSTHQTEDILESYEAVVVLSRGEILHSGSVPEFLGHAPARTPRERRAEAAYIQILTDHGHQAA